MRKLIAGNWKMNGLRADAAALAAALGDGAAGLACDLLVCPPATLLAEIAAILRGTGIAVGGQDCHAAASGPHTGDISAPMLRDAGATWVILGHSERRLDHAESSALVQEKSRAATAAGLTPIICVGETEQQRNSGNADQVVTAQLDASVPPGFTGAIAYEPIWAIGTGRTASTEDCAAMHRAIREQLVATLGEPGATIRILYGGSVKPAGAAALFSVPDVGGALVGGASLTAADFLAIARAA